MYVLPSHYTPKPKENSSTGTMYLYDMKYKISFIVTIEDFQN